MIVRWRLDDRLIHGQVLAVLVPQLNIDSIVTVSSVVSGDEFRKELFHLACPPELELYFVNVEEASKDYSAWQTGNKRYLILFDDPREMLELAKTVGTPPQINLANLGFQAGRKAFFEAIYLNPEEEKVLKELSEMGSELCYQQVPGSAACKFIPGKN